MKNKVTVGTEVPKRTAISNASPDTLFQRRSISTDVNDVLNSPGQSLDRETRREMESKFEHDFSRVRVHTDNKASNSAQALGALAYSAGSHVIIRTDRAALHTTDLKQMLAHELAHVAQARVGDLPKPDRVVRGENCLEKEAQFAAGHSNESNYIKVTKGAPARIYLLADPEIEDYLLRLERLSGQFYSDEPETLDIQPILNELEGLDLSNPDNLIPVTRTIQENYSDAVFLDFLALTESRVIEQYEPTDSEVARMQQTESLLQTRRRGGYGQFGPGVIAPVLVQPGRHLLPYVEAAENVLSGSGAFLQGLLAGLTGSLGEQEREALRNRLMQSSILNAVFPVVFTSGAVVGIVEDVIDAVKEIYQVISDFDQFVESMSALFNMITSPESADIAMAIGRQVGQDYGRRITELARGNVFEFSFGLGRMLGPTIVYTILAFLGVPELLLSSVITRLMTVLGPFLQRFPRLLSIAERIALRLTRRPAYNTIDELEAEIEADLDRSFSATFSEETTSLQTGGPSSGVVSQPPEVSAGFAAHHLTAFRRLLGRSFDDSQVSDLARVWNSVSRPGQAESLSLSNSRRLFNNQRARFWRAVRRDPAARRLFEDAGCVFEGGPTTTPFYRLSNGTRYRLSIDHIVERQTDPGRALDASNLRISSIRENTVVLRQLHEQDPYLRLLMSESE